MVARNYWWPGVTKEVGRYVDGCDTCQRYKNWSEVPAEKLMPNVIPKKPWSHISADCYESPKKEQVSHVFKI